VFTTRYGLDLLLQLRLLKVLSVFSSSVRQTFIMPEPTTVQMRKAYGILVETTEGKTSPEWPRRRWRDIKLGLKYRTWEYLSCIQEAAVNTGCIRGRDLNSWLADRLRQECFMAMLWGVSCWCSLSGGKERESLWCEHGCGWNGKFPHFNKGGAYNYCRF